MTKTITIASADKASQVLVCLCRRPCEFSVIVPNASRCRFGAGSLRLTDEPRNLTPVHQCISFKVRLHRVSPKKCRTTCPNQATLLAIPVSSYWCSGVMNDQ